MSFPEDCQTGQQGEMYCALPPILTSESSCVSTGLPQGPLKLILTLVVIASVKPQIKTRRKKCEKIEGFAENGKNKEDCSQSRVSPDKIGRCRRYDHQERFIAGPDAARLFGRRSFSHFIRSCSIDGRIKARRSKKKY